MIRQSIHRWLTRIYCLKCAKPEVEELLQSAKKSFDIFKEYKSNDPKSAYIMFKENVEYFENLLGIIKEKE